VYVGDSGNLRVRAISPAGVVSTLAGSGAAGYVDGAGAGASFTATGAVISDGAGNVYVPDRNSNVVRKITPAGVVSTFAGSGIRGHVDGPVSSAQFNGPQRGGGVDKAGNVYILDTDDWRIRKISRDGTVTTVAGTGNFGYRGAGYGGAILQQYSWAYC
jgi:serine/threonine protein kinase, bacterial